MRLKDKVIIVTGGAGLIGTAFSKAISKEGGIVIIADIDLNKAIELSQKIDRSFPIELDITSSESLKIMIEQLHKNFGRIDAIVNNAYPRNQNYGRTLMDVEYNDFCENLNLNLGGYFLTSQMLMKYFMNQGRGNIVQISSIYGLIAPRFEIYKGTLMTVPVEYSVIKSGLIHLTKYLAKFCKGKNIRVNSLSPGGIEDGQPEVFLKAYQEYCLSKGMLSPDDLTGGLVYLLGDESSFVNGQNLIIDDGFIL